MNENSNGLIGQSFPKGSSLQVSCEELGRLTAFDSSVVFHEFTHGVTNRLVGGRLYARALDATQSSGMGEGWSDYVACTITLQFPLRSPRSSLKQRFLI